MAEAEKNVELKRKAEDEPDEEGDAEEDEWVGPLPNEASTAKKRKVLEYERVYLENLPSAAMYERSYMHRDVITQIVCSKTDFIITSSQDGHIKFWKKKEDHGIEFVKHFRSHLGVIESIAVSAEGALLCSVGDDQAMKVFDVVNFDMINMLKLGFHPGQSEWIYNPGDPISTVACSEKSTGKIFVYDGRGSNQPLHVFDKMHSSPLAQIRLNPKFRVIVSADKAGMLEYWTGLRNDFRFPKYVQWEYKTGTDLYEFVKHKTYPTSLTFSSDGKKMATIASDRKVRIFRFLTGKLMRVFDESLTMFTELQQMRQQLPDMEFGRRMAVERELEKVDGIRLTNIIFDETGHFVLYGTMLGIKVINVETNRCVRILGKLENIRVVQLGLFQGVAKASQVAPTVEMKASDNPALDNMEQDPTIFCTAFKKNRFYMFSKREPEDTKSADSDRDIFNEKPSKEEVMAATQAEGPKRVSDSAIIHTTMGDIHIKLFPVEYVPRSVPPPAGGVTRHQRACALWFLSGAPKRWRTSASTAGTATSTATYSTGSSRCDPSTSSTNPPPPRPALPAASEPFLLSPHRAGLHEPYGRSHGDGHGGREHLGGRVRGRIPRHAEARPPVHAQHGQRGPRHQRLPVLCHRGADAVAGQQAHGVWAVHQGHGGGAEDLQPQSQPQDGQTVRGHQHHQHHRQVIARPPRVLYSDSFLFFYQIELLKNVWSETFLLRFISRFRFDNLKKKKTTKQPEECGQLVYFTATTLRINYKKLRVTKVSMRVCASTLKNQKLHQLCGNAFYMCIIFISIFKHSKHYTAMQIEELNVK
uniref:Peptidylprolyl isomerase domain and WD repeat containing 1 n=1 Tax=Gasterosteus aculeatus aculeatus TaxID=481459 RepID=G3PT16_GASAC